MVQQCRLLGGCGTFQNISKRTQRYPRHCDLEGREHGGQGLRHLVELTAQACALGLSPYLIPLPAFPNIVR